MLLPKDVVQFGRGVQSFLEGRPHIIVIARLVLSEVKELDEAI